jgi:hypothetical protein
MAEAPVVKIGAALAAVLSFAARTADACPACTTRGSGGYTIPLLLGAMILTPYLVATVVMRIVRKAEAERLLEDAPWKSPTGGAPWKSPTGGAPATGSAGDKA